MSCCKEVALTILSVIILFPYLMATAPSVHARIRPSGPPIGTVGVNSESLRELKAQQSSNAPTEQSGFATTHTNTSLKRVFDSETDICLPVS